jgi:hypothetical protein
MIMNKKVRRTDQPMQPIHNCSYILRLWRVDASEAADWRASLEIPETGKRMGFASLEQLFAYLMDLSESNSHVQSIEDKEDCAE